jgi:ABC-type dipeptide/oligopeptide/nickel transport system permease subunit
MATQNDVARARREGELFGIPLGDLGWFQTLLMGFAAGFVAFFLSTFLAIVSMLIYQLFTQHVPPYEKSYQVVGLPVGIVVLVLALGFLGVQWSRRMARKGRKA